MNTPAPTQTAARPGGKAGASVDLGTAIRLAGVSKTYGSGEVAVHALKNVDLEVPRGQFVVVLGPSGSGKTTLMNVIGGLEPPTSGSVVVGGRDITGLDDAKLTDHRRVGVGFVFQFFNLVPALTAFENVALVAELVGRSPAEASAALAAVGLQDRADHFPSAMSGGEQQRVAIARALVKEPALLLCDEPTGSLDLETGRQVLSALHQTGRQAGRTVVLVTHNSAIARMADRVLHMGSGRLLDDKRQPHPITPAEVTW